MAQFWKIIKPSGNTALHADDGQVDNEWGGENFKSYLNIFESFRPTLNKMGHGQCDQIVLHFKGLCDNFFKKVAQTESDILGYFENHLKLAMTTFWARIGKIWATFYSTIWSHWSRTQKTRVEPFLRSWWAVGTKMFTTNWRKHSPWR